MPARMTPTHKAKPGSLTVSNNAQIIKIFKRTGVAAAAAKRSREFKIPDNNAAKEMNKI
jgi:hypothetical protein